MRFQEFVGSSDVDGTSRPFAAAETKPVGFAGGGEGEDRIAGQRAVGLGEIARDDKVLHNGDFGLSGLRERLQRKLQRAAIGKESA